MKYMELHPISAVKPYPGNPTVDAGAVSVVAWSIREIGFVNPILVDGKDEVISGHIRLAAARSLGMTEVPVVVCESLHPDLVRFLRLADGKDLMSCSFCGMGYPEGDGMNKSLQLNTNTARITSINLQKNRLTVMIEAKLEPAHLGPAPLESANIPASKPASVPEAPKPLSKKATIPPLPLISLSRHTTFTPAGTLAAIVDHPTVCNVFEDIDPAWAVPGGRAKK
jgi:hypothetical protein